MKRAFLFFIVLFWVPKLHAQVNQTQQMVIQFLDTLQKNAYMGKSMQWDSIRPAFIAETRHINEVNQLKPYFEKLLKTLKDGHSSLFFEETGQDKESEQDQFEKMAVMTDKEAGIPPKNFQHYMINSKYAYINVPPVMLENRKYVDTIGIQLKNLDAQEPKAWIIDLTENNGGNIMPMIWQFPSLLDTDKTYAYVDAQGKETKAITYYTVESPEDLTYFQLFQLEPDQVKPVKLRHNDIPIILLTSNITASSGEFFTAHFKGQKNVKVIGQKTGGLTSGNAPFNINKNCMVMLTTSVLKDRNGKVYKIAEGIEPDLVFPIEMKPKNGKTKLTYNEMQEVIKNAKQRYIDQAIAVIENKSGD
ncbi:MAG: S41 family peptidase [Sphingobacterium sp.]